MGEAAGSAGALQSDPGETARLRARVAELEQRERELTDFVENASLGLHWVGPDGRILWANQAELDLLGYRREEYIGRPIADFHADPETIADILRRLAAKETLHNYEATLVAKDGSLRHVLISSNVYWENGRFVHTRCFTRDISDRKRFEHELETRDQQLRIALRAAQMGTWEWAIGTEKVTWSGGLENIHGLPEGGFEGTLAAVMAEIHPDDREAFQTALSKALNSAEDFDVEYRIVLANGQVRWVHGRGSVERDPSGTPRRMTGACIEITDRKRNEILISKQKQLLELEAQGTPLSDVLCAVVGVVEENCDGGLLASVLLADGCGRLRLGAAPNLPDEYNRAIDGVPVGPNIGSCGTAAFRRERVVVSDIAGDPLWEGYRELALQHGLRACWSTPVTSSRGEVLGTFAVYSREAREPRPDELRAMELLCQTTAIILERRRAEGELEHSIAQLHALYRIASAATGPAAAEKIADEALDGLMQCIGPDRAAVLLRDGDGVLRFKAWRGLSAEYRSRVEGHSPWAPGTARAVPVLVPEVERDEALAAFRESILDEGIHALGFIPVHAYGGVAGKFMIYYDTPHEFSAEETRLAQVLAAQIGSTLERKRSQDALRESEERFRSLGECSPVGIFLTDLNGNAVYTNPRCDEICGLGAEQARAGQWMRFVHPDERDGVAALWSSAARSGHALSRELRLVTPSGEVRWIHLRTSPMVSSSGEPLGQVGTVEDITERKGVERRLLMQYEVTRILSESATVADAAPRVVSAIGRLLDWQTGAWWAIDREASVLHCLQVWQSESAGAADLVSDNLARTFRKGNGLPGRVWAECKPVWIRDVRTELQFPRVVSMTECGLRTAIAFPIMLDSSEAAGVIEFFSADVREPDALLLHTLEAVGTLIGQFVEWRHLEEQLRQSQKMESIGLLAGGVAHDFNNLLVGVMGNASLAADYLDEAHPARRLMDDVVRASERAADLTRQLLAYAGRGQFVITRFDMSELIREVSGLLRTTVPKNIRLDLLLESGLPTVEADASQMQQLVMNLLINGVEAIGEERAGVVSVRTSVRQIDQAYIRAHLPGHSLAAGSYVMLEVRDTGCGMDAKTRERIFDPFFSTKALGRGLGLAAAAGIVRSYKGAISVESAPGEGSAFLVLLPVAAVGEIGQAELTVRSEPEPASEGIVLVIDDEDVVRRTARLALERRGYRVALASDGAEGLAELRRVPDVCAVVLDLTMPVMSGDAAARIMKAERPEIPILLSSGFNESDARRRFGDCPVDGFIQKPYKAADLYAAVRAVAGKAVAVKRKPNAA